MASDYLKFKEYFRKRKQLNQSVPIANRSSVQDNAHLNKTVKKSQCEILGIITDKPKHRQYACIASRLSSFDNWPAVNREPIIEQLSEAGFAYTGTSDSVRCFYCGIGLKDWPEEACPWEQHVLASPTCGHVIQCKGKGYVNWILGECDDNSEDIACGFDKKFDSELDTVQLAMKRNEDAVEVARLYCSDEDIIKAAIKSFIKNDIQRKISAVELVKAVEELKERQENEDESSDSETEDDVAETNRQLKDPVTCKICFDAISCIITLPCGHMACCSQCAPALTRCAICRTQIKGTVRAQMVA